VFGEKTRGDRTETETSPAQRSSLTCLRQVDHRAGARSSTWRCARPRVWYLALSPTTMALSNEVTSCGWVTCPFRPAGAPIGTREGACAPHFW